MNVGTGSFVQFMATPDAKEYLCEISSHKYNFDVNAVLTAEAIDLVAMKLWGWLLVAGITNQAPLTQKLQSCDKLEISTSMDAAMKSRIPIRLGRVEAESPPARKCVI